jgi:hypothetical protein
VKRLGGALTVLLILSLVRVASATCEATSTAPFVAVSYDPQIGEADRGRIASELAADLADRSIDVCDASRPGNPVARVSITPTSGGVSIRLEVRDALTSKDVARNLDTSRTPEDGRPLAVALATAELLRASWAELALRKAPPPAIPVPAPVKKVVEDSIAREPIKQPLPAPQPTHPVGLWVMAASEVFSSGFVRIGADVRLSVDLGPRFTLGARGGFRRAITRTGPDGDVAADALLVGLDGSFGLLARTRRFGLDPFVRVDVARITYHATPTPDAIASSTTLDSLEATGGVRGSFHATSSLSVLLELGIGGTIIAANALDTTNTVSSTCCVLGTASLGFKGSF